MTTTIAAADKETGTGVQERLDALTDRIRTSAGSQIGYPANQIHDYSPLLPFMQYSLNNVGDPFHQSNYQANTHDFEREVIQHFASLMRLPTDEAWGYVTSGGTEGNLYGLYLARELHPDAMFYFSEEAHYSVLKNLRLLNVPYTMVRRRYDGEIDYQDLRDMLLVNRELPAVIMATIGTTMRGAVDDIPRIGAILDDIGIRESYIHADAALSGMILPFVPNPQPFGFDAGIDSISVSGHKLLGAPLPCGVVVTKKQYVERVGRAIECVGVHDTTISGSRNGFTPLLLWYALKQYGDENIKQLVNDMLETAEYAVGKFNQNGIPAWRHRNSATVVFPRPGSEVFAKWQIAPEGQDAHIITMPHVTREMVDRLVEDCSR